MSQFATLHCAWRTATYGDDETLFTRDVQTLGEHLNACRKSPAHLFTLRCFAETMHGFVASRFITTLAILVLTLVVGFWVM